MTDQTSADDVARAQLLDEAKRQLDRYDAASHSSDEDEWADLVFRLMELAKAQRTTVVDAQALLADRAAALQAERARTIEACVNACLAIERVECGEHEGHGRTAMNAACVAAIRALASAGTAGDTCCDNEDRTMDGGCRNCGDPSF